MELLTKKGLKIPKCFKNNFVEVRCLLLGEIIEQKHAKMRLFLCVRLGAFLAVTRRLMSQNMAQGHNSVVIVTL